MENFDYRGATPETDAAPAQQPHPQQPHSQQAHPQQPSAVPNVAWQQAYYYPAQGAYAPYYAPPKQKKRLSTGLIVFICAISAVLVFGFGVMISAMVKSGNSAPQAPESQSEIADNFDSLDDAALTQGVDSGNNDLRVQINSKHGKQLSTADIVKRYQDSVLGISVYSTDGILEGEASGIAVGTNQQKTKTYIVTCAHVITDARDDVLKVMDRSGKEYLAAVIGFDASCDVGVLSIEKVGFKAVEFGDSDAITAGETVVAMGNPGGSEFFGSVTQGVVSATDRMLSVSGTVMAGIQHDAAINPGSSGGALFNVYGQVVGINYSKIALDDYEGMNFAVPSALVVEKANLILAKGVKTYGVKIGLEYYVSASYFDENYKQLIINSIDESGDLYGKAKKGDFIIAVNGNKITDKYTIVKEIAHKQAGDTITMTIASKNEKTGKYDTKEITVKLIEKKAD